MSKFQEYAKKYFFYFAPIMLILVILDFVVTNQNSRQLLDGNSFFYWVVGVLVILWFLDLIYLAFAIVFSNALRNIFVRKIAKIRENDEREAQLTGAISRKTFISTVAIFVFLLILSTLRFEVYKFKNQEVEGGNHGRIAAGFGLNIIKESEEKSSEDSNRLVMFKYAGLPLSADGVLLLVLGIQVGAFYYYSRREYTV